MYHIIGKVGRLQDPLLDEEPSMIDVLAVYNSIRGLWVVAIKLVSKLVNFGAVKWFWLSHVSLFVKLPVFVHDDIIQQLVADVLLELQQQLHFFGVTLDGVRYLFAHLGELLLEAQPSAAVLEVFLVFLDC